MRKFLGFLAVAGLLLIAAPAQQAAASVLTPGAAMAVQSGTEDLTTEVRYGRRSYGRRYYAPRRYAAPRRYYAPQVYVPRVFAPRRYYY